jgi:hypothetical protein
LSHHAVHFTRSLGLDHQVITVEAVGGPYGDELLDQTGTVARGPARQLVADLMTQIAQLM